MWIITHSSSPSSLHTSLPPAEKQAVKEITGRQKVWGCEHQVAFVKEFVLQVILIKLHVSLQIFQISRCWRKARCCSSFLKNENRLLWHVLSHNDRLEPLFVVQAGKQSNFFSQKNCNTYLIYGEIYERCWQSSQKSWKPNADTKTDLKQGWFSLGNKASWSWGQVLGMLSLHSAGLQSKEDSEGVADTPLAQVPCCFWSRTSPARQ